jgi:hypothetical protein
MRQPTRVHQLFSIVRKNEPSRERRVELYDLLRKVLAKRRELGLSHYARDLFDRAPLATVARNLSSDKDQLNETVRLLNRLKTFYRRERHESDTDTMSGTSSYTSSYTSSDTSSDTSSSNTSDLPPQAPAEPDRRTRTDANTGALRRTGTPLIATLLFATLVLNIFQVYVLCRGAQCDEAVSDIRARISDMSKIPFSTWSIRSAYSGMQTKLAYAEHVYAAFVEFASLHVDVARRATLNRFVRLFGFPQAP